MNDELKELRKLNNSTDGARSDVDNMFLKEMAMDDYCETLYESLNDTMLDDVFNQYTPGLFDDIDIDSDTEPMTDHMDYTYESNNLLF